ncbi:TetR/AcrR family transcriptional regulator [Conexibacter stalactiti]|uniref:TetR/AcrR family transcriptional regulator n=2 Tax=Conexibacter stalactiti TaxID=1940611 RepID=A0ABU4HHQ1_9ACTN|nr:TetR/AcrR family transcriptional regulator [Conexibacter stalactiti]MEC5033474.1 TetR/AcrR family transcriptional regulator [Conexibacter stalactiti]
MNAMVQSTTATTRSRLPRAEREQQVLDIAHAAFAEHGYGAVTMDEVAAAAGVTKPLLYAYFGNKERLYLACMERSGEAMLSAVGAAVASASSPAEALREGLKAFFAFVDGDRDAWRVLFDETLPAGGELTRSVSVYRDRLLALVAQTQLALIPEHNRERAATEVEALSNALLGASEALARWWLRTGAMPPADAAELLVATVEPGLQARAALSALPGPEPASDAPSNRHQGAP